LSLRKKEESQNWGEVGVRFLLPQNFRGRLPKKEEMKNPSITTAFQSVSHGGEKGKKCLLKKKTSGEKTLLVTGREDVKMVKRNLNRNGMGRKRTHLTRRGKGRHPRCKTMEGVKSDF